MDPLSEVLALLDVRAATPSRLEAGGTWALRFNGNQHVKLGAVLSGRCWVAAEGGEPVSLEAGDCYLLRSGSPYEAASEPGLEPADGGDVFAGVWPDTVYYQVGPGDQDRCVLVGGALSFDETLGALLVGGLPPCVRIAADSPRARVLQPILQLLNEETAADSPGSVAMRVQLTQIVFVQAMRTLLEVGDAGSGWLAALSDDCVGKALALIHDEPARRWTVAELAAAAGLSRSAFAQKFRAMVGLPPLDYVARWRIRRAGHELRSSDRTVASVAADFGYGSESAFSHAFKRITGEPPTGYRHRAPTYELP
ncbi:AraC family transcriptional regulator [Nonomuraea sp. M3C6]|uniref:AraC family transcriptional regulator n=1 Tax=Nonomuraea marmarensis TaxID=3351344 RepID=A0ABW7ADJ4_9ACTN